MNATGERIAKVIARAGVCSRRQAEQLIAAGQVAVDGKVLKSPACNVTRGQKITIDGKPLPRPEPAGLWRYHKPRGLVTTSRDPQGRPTVFQALPEGLPRLQAVGRLDITSEGLLLLTNDGELKRRLELPSTGWLRRYRVRVHGTVDEPSLAQLADGVTVEGQRYGPIDARLDRQVGANAWLTMSLREGKNREVRRVCEHLGLRVSRLIRVSFGPFHLGKLDPGSIEPVPARILADQLGIGQNSEQITKGWAQARSRGGSAKGRNHAHHRRPA